jgi:hypothetical protein
MILDSQLLFSDAQAITAAAASTNSVDFGAGVKNLGVGEQINIAINVDVALTDAGSDSTLTVALQTDTDPAFGSPTTVKTLVTIPALAPIGAAYFASIEPDDVVERYVRLYYTPNSGNLTTGSVTAAVVKDIQKQVIYPKGYTIV